jgi:phospholipid transport system transporter-binding protein
MTFATATALHAAGLAAFAGSSETALVVDCSGVAAADSAGLAVLIDWLAWGRNHGRSVKLEGVPEEVHALARISDLDPLLEGGG